ncbi:hypothetical protein GQR58_030448 [Nymphon striatum]|nr:hypothetical protein GQR58_030448 [Nymphon striatum]
MKYVLLSGLDGTGLLMQPFIDAFVACNTKLEAQDIIVVDYPEHLHSYNVAIDHARKQKLKAIVFVATFAESPLKLPSNVATLMRFMPTQNKLAAKIILPLLIGKWHSKSFEKLFLNALKQTSANSSPALFITSKPSLIAPKAINTFLERSELVKLLYLLPSADLIAAFGYKGESPAMNKEIVAALS